MKSLQNLIKEEDMVLTAKNSVQAGATAPRDAPIVFVVDDDISVRESLEPLIARAGWRPQLFGSAQEFLSREWPACPSCLLLDVSLPDLNGLELQQRLTGTCAWTPIIFITGHGDIDTSVQAMKAGAVDFLTKPLAAPVLLNAIRSGLELSRRSLEREANLRILRDRYQSLSRRERQVMELVVKGYLNKQVGAELGIQEITVKAHRRGVMHKMDVRTLADLVRIAMCLSGLEGFQRVRVGIT